MKTSKTIQIADLKEKLQAMTTQINELKQESAAKEGMIVFLCDFVSVFVAHKNAMNIYMKMVDVY